MPPKAKSLTGCLMLLAAIAPAQLHAQATQGPVERQSPTPGQLEEPDFTTQMFGSSRANFLGDMFGLRTFLGNYGISLGLENSTEVFANATGGIKHGASVDGLALMNIGLDTQKAFGWEGGIFNISALGIYGANFSQGYLGTLQTASGIVADPTVRLWEIWYQQSFLNGKMDVKVGQQSLDQEFMLSQGAGLFLNTSDGWPEVPTADLYAGGPAYPLSSLGVRLRGEPTGAITLLGGVFQDNPPGGPFDNDGQLLGSTRWGGNFNLRTGALIIAELQYAINQPSAGQLDTKPGLGGLPGTYKIGFWFDTAKFPDQRFDDTGLSLADPNSSGNPQFHWHNYSIYGVMDQTIWQPGGDDPRVAAIFARPMFAPAKQNLIDFSIDGGVTLKAPLPGRDNDTFGVGFGVANVSSRASQLDQDRAFFSGSYVPTRGAETFVEVTYQIQLAPWWQVQPDFQYFWMPGGGVANPNNPTQRIGNEAVFAVRTNVTF